MAVTTECPIWDYSWPAAADYSSSGQYKWVKLQSDGTVKVCDTDGERAIGVLQNAPRSAEAASVRLLGESHILVAVSEALVAGDTVGTTNVGTATKVEATATGADLGDVVLGIASQTKTGSSPAGVLGSVLLFGPQGLVTA
jgi:hypothetical protein